MELIEGYSIAFATFLLLYPVRWFLLSPLVRHLLRPVLNGFTKLASHLPVLFAHCRHALVLHRRYWMSITFLESIVIHLYLGGNIAALCFGKDNLAATAGMLATINATPLFVGGRTNPLANFSGIPLSTYYIFHHFIGRVVVVEGLLHSALLLWRSQRDQVTVSGYIASGGLLLILCTSFWFMRRYFYRSFSKIHFVLSLATLSGMTWHVFLQASERAKIPALIAGSLWTVTTIYRLLRLIFHATSGKITNEPIIESNVSRIDVHCDRPIRTFPGSYFYVFLQGKLMHYDLLSSYPMTVMWHTPGQEPGAHDISFLVSHHSRPLRAVRFAKGEHLLLDGPYGQDLKLQHFETVMLAAKGAGILATLPLALSLLKNRRPNIQGPKINIFWSLEDSSQERWVTGELMALQAMDADNEHFVFWCLYPSMRDVNPGFQISPYWRRFYGVSTSLYLHSMIDASSGSTAVVASGDAQFSLKVRNAAISRMTLSRPIKFIELQYRPYMTSSNNTPIIDEEKDLHRFQESEKPKEKPGGLDEISLNSPKRSTNGRVKEE